MRSLDKVELLRFRSRELHTRPTQAFLSLYIRLWGNWPEKCKKNGVKFVNYIIFSLELFFHNFLFDMKRLKSRILFRCSRGFATRNSLWSLRKQAIIIMGVTKLIHKQNWRFRSRELNTRPTQAFFLCVSIYEGKKRIKYVNSKVSFFHQCSDQ